MENKTLLSCISILVTLMATQDSPWFIRYPILVAAFVLLMMTLFEEQVKIKSMNDSRKENTVSLH